MADFDPPFANANGDIRMPTAGEIADGFGCGPADIDLFNGLINAFYSELGALIAKSGLTPSNADFTQVAKASRSQRLNFALVGGTGNALTMTLDPAPAGLGDLTMTPLRFLPTANNTTAATLNVNGLGAREITTRSGRSLVADDIRVGEPYEVLYDGTSKYRLLAPVPSETKSPRRTIYATSSGTLLIETGERTVHARGWGGGGGGGFSIGSSGVGAGGGAAGFFDVWFTAAVGASFPFTIGAGGVGGTGGAGAGTGGTTVIDTIAFAGGGGPGASGSAGIPGSAGGPGGGAGAPGGSGLVVPGAPGGTGVIIDPSSLLGGLGGAAPFGGASAGVNQAAVGLNGYFPGGGGGGAALTSGANGGNGAPGLIIIETYPW